MAIRFRSNFSGTRNKLRKAKSTVRMTFGGEMKRAARIVAVQLAHATQPFGFDEGAKTKGEVATASDIRRCYATPGQVYAAFPDVRFAKAFYARLKKGDIAHAQRLVDAHCPTFKGTPIGHFDLFLHQGRRNKRGRIPQKQKPLQIVVNPKALFDYIKAEVKLVGWGKAGWAACARILESTRGIPRWVTRQKAPGTFVDGTRSTDTPFIILINQVSYAASILTEADKTEAVRIGLDRYFKDRRVTDVVRSALRRELTNG
ncbi:MAG TPA: hypothetical protein VJS88_00390 [Chthoniobacterales bacterium]|nr:hypothetical protein [Chthoniobacterales bacterium]